MQLSLANISIRVLLIHYRLCNRLQIHDDDDQRRLIVLVPGAYCSVSAPDKFQPASEGKHDGEPDRYLTQGLQWSAGCAVVHSRRRSGTCKNGMEAKDVIKIKGGIRVGGVVIAPPGDDIMVGMNVAMNP